MPLPSVPGGLRSTGRSAAAGQNIGRRGVLVELGAGVRRRGFKQRPGAQVRPALLSGQVTVAAPAAGEAFPRSSIQGGGRMHAEWGRRAHPWVGAAASRLLPLSGCL